MAFIEIMEDRNIQYDLADTIIERPNAFEVSGRPFYLYPVTLGKSYLLSRVMDSLELNEDNIRVNPYMEAMRVCKNHREEVLRLIVYHSFRRKKDLFDYKLIEARCRFFDNNISWEELTQLFLIVLSHDKSDKFIKHLGIDKELDLKHKVTSSKKEQGGSISFGGKSIYGTLIDFACERYGWSYEYVLWGISLVNLKMLMNDSVSTIYLTKDEQKKLRIPTDRTIVSGDSKENIAKMKKFFKD